MSDYKKIRKDGRTQGVHRIIAEEVVGRKLGFNEVVHHIDGNKFNNDPSNLMVVSRQEHARIHSKDIDRSKPVIQMSADGEVLSIWPSAREAERNTNVSFQNICKCCKGQRKTAGGYAWRYA